MVHVLDASFRVSMHLQLSMRLTTFVRSVYLSIARDRGSSKFWGRKNIQYFPWSPTCARCLSLGHFWLGFCTVALRFLLPNLCWVWNYFSVWRCRAQLEKAVCLEICCHQDFGTSNTIVLAWWYYWFSPCASQFLERLFTASKPFHSQSSCLS
jgi:hypothetical protein